MHSASAKNSVERIAPSQPRSMNGKALWATFRTTG